MRESKLERWRTWLRWLCSATFIPFGVLHVVVPGRFLPIMPPMIPYPREVVIATGVAEILGGIGLLDPRTRKAAAIGLALYAIGVYPANVYHAFAGKHVPPLPDSWWYHGPRLAFQPVFVWWALFAGGLVHKPETAVDAAPVLGTPEAASRFVRICCGSCLPVPSSLALSRPSGRRRMPRNP